MNVSELYGFLSQKIPASLSCSWDNDGLMCCPDPSREVKKLLVTLDATGEAVDYALKNGFDAILTHHPLIFRGIKNVTCDSAVPSRVIKLVGNGISVLSFHTRLDALDGGVNDVLSDLIGLENTVKFGTPGEEIGRIGDLGGEMSIDEFAKLVKEKLSCPGVLIAECGKKVKRVAVVGGEGGDFAEAAKAAGADTFLCGRAGYHIMTDARDNGINIVEAGHYYTERPVCEKLRCLVGEADKNIKTEIFDSINIILK